MEMEMEFNGMGYPWKDVNLITFYWEDTSSGAPRDSNID